MFHPDDYQAPIQIITDLINAATANDDPLQAEAIRRLNDWVESEHFGEKQAFVFQQALNTATMPQLYHLLSNKSNKLLFKSRVIYALALTINDAFLLENSRGLFEHLLDFMEKNKQVNQNPEAARALKLQRRAKAAHAFKEPLMPLASREIVHS